MKKKDFEYVLQGLKPGEYEIPAQVFEYFDGKINKKRALELIQQHTRNYAKRQLTWFRKDSGFIWCKPDLNEILPLCK